MHRRRPGRGLLGIAFPAVLIGVVAATQVSLAPDRPTAEIGRIELPVDSPFWTSDPIRVDATAVALAWQGEDPESAAVRVGDDGESWGPWTGIHDPEDHGPDPSSSEADMETGDISEAVYVGDARWLQFRITGSPRDLEVAYVDTTGRSRSLAQRFEALVDRLQFGRLDVAVAAPDQPDVVPRSEWGGDQCRAANGGAEVEYHDGVRLMFVHHTLHSADSNGYEAEEVADLLYAICSFHVGVRGWSDIGYNALVDKFGRVWEGRAGGLAQSVIGAHTSGFNSYSTGVAFIGDYRQVVPSEASEQALIDFAAWRLDIEHVDPRSSMTLESLGSSRWEKGVSVTMPALAGHRDASLTVCPGDGIQYRLGGWAEQIALTGGAKIYGDWHQIDLVPGSQVDGYEPTDFPFYFSEQMSWALAIVDSKGTEVFSQTGVGIEGSVTWAGTLDDMPLPGGDYTMHLEAVPSSGAPTPRPATFDFSLGSFKPPFADDEGSIHESDIGLISALGITTGCGPELFCPGQRLARWQMALFLTRLHDVAGFALPADVDQGFTDVVGLPPEYQTAINQLAQLGVTQGTGLESFDPQGIVSREQMALFLIRWLALAGNVLPDGSDQGFADISHIPAEHQTAINRLAQLGITTGTVPGSFTPDGAVTREQMASFLARTIAIVPGIEMPTETSSASVSTTDTTTP